MGATLTEDEANMVQRFCQDAQYRKQILNQAQSNNLKVSHQLKCFIETYRAQWDELSVGATPLSGCALTYLISRW